MGNFNLTVKDKLIIVLINIIFIVSVAKGRYMVLALFGVLVLFVIVFFKPDYRKLPRRVFTVFLYPLFVSIFIPFMNPGNVLASLDLRLFTITVTDKNGVPLPGTLVRMFPNPTEPSDPPAELDQTLDETKTADGEGKVYFDYTEYYKTKSTKRRVDIFFQIEEHILSIKDGKKRFVRNTQALMKALDLAITSDEAKTIRKDAALFQSVARSLVKTVGRFAGIIWGNDVTAVVSDRWWQNRKNSRLASLNYKKKTQGRHSPLRKVQP